MFHSVNLEQGKRKGGDVLSKLPCNEITYNEHQVYKFILLFIFKYFIEGP